MFWLFVAGMAALTALVLIYGNNLPDYRGLATYAPPVATRLYASDGSLLIEYAEERRVFIDFADMPPQLVNAFIAAEDKNFWTHPGIDIFGIIRATGNNVLHMVGLGGKFTGASTITQQVSKNFFLTTERTMGRKVREAILSLKLERAFSKEHIMTLYLNQIFLGARAYGVGSASLMYFNKPVKDLNLAECAFLASLPKAPNDMARAMDRRNYVLRRMAAEGFITSAEQQAASSEPLNINDNFRTQMSDDFGYFSEEVRRELLNKLGREKLYNDGLYIKTTLDPELQRAASAALKSGLDAYNNGRGGPEKLQGALIALNPYTGRVVAMVGGYSFAQSSFNRATQGLRQIGSTIKPFVYLAALERGISPEQLLLDAPIVGWREGDTLWKPENYDKKFLGEVPLRLSLETSRNVPTVRLVEQIGVRDAIDAARRFGIYDEKLTDLNLSLALGSGETTLARLTLGYAAIMNGGYLHKLKLVDYVQDRYGQVLGSGAEGASKIEWAEGIEPKIEKETGEPLSDPQSLYQMVSILTGVVERGTGRGARVPGQIIGGKTGTTNEVRDVWFVGFTKNLVVGIYMGYDTPRAMGLGAGSHQPAAVFAKFMTTATRGEISQPFSVPGGLSQVRVNRRSGQSAADDTIGTIINEYFKPGQKPNPKTSIGNNGGRVEVGGVF